MGCFAIDAMLAAERHGGRYHAERRNERWDVLPSTRCSPRSGTTDVTTRSVVTRDSAVNLRLLGAGPAGGDCLAGKKDARGRAGYSALGFGWAGESVGVFGAGEAGAPGDSAGGRGGSSWMIGRGALRPNRGGAPGTSAGGGAESC